jgi:uncharacterized protein
LECPIGINHRGGLLVARYEEKVRQSVRTILSTVKGERVMRPDFGCDIHAFVFTAMDSASLTLIKSAVREALVRWEPRIDVTEVSVVAEARAEGQLSIAIAYTIRITNVKANLVYPFYLQREPK